MYAKALREYPSPYITPDMYRKLLEWLTWVQYVNGDNRYPRQQRVLLQLEPGHPDARPLGHPPQHPRRVQLHDHRRHRGRPAAAGRHAGAVADRRRLGPLRGQQPALPRRGPDHGLGQAAATARTYTGAPEGMSAYVDGRRVFTVDDTRPRDAGTPRPASVTVLDGSDHDRRPTTRAAAADGGGRQPLRQRPGGRHVPEGRRRPDAPDRLGAQPGRGQAGHRLVHHDHADAAGDGAGERGRRLHHQRPADPVRAANGPQHDLGHAGLAQRAGLARGRPRRSRGRSTR